MIKMIKIVKKLKWALFVPAFVLVLSILSGYIFKNDKSFGIYMDMTSFTDDTVLYAWGGRPFKALNAKLIKVEVRYEGVDASDATFSFGLSDFGDTYNEADPNDDLFPYTLNYDADTITIPSARTTSGVRASKMFSIVDFPSEYFSIWLDRGSIIDGYIHIKVNLYETE